MIDDKSLLSNLKTNFEQDEKVECTIAGLCTGEITQNGIFVITNKRLIIYDEKKLVTYGFFKVTQIKSNLLNSKITIETISGQIVIKKIRAGNVSKFINLLWQRIPQNRKDEEILQAITDEALKLDDLKNKCLINDLKYNAEKQRLSLITSREKTMHPKKRKILNVSAIALAIIFVVSLSIYFNHLFYGNIEPMTQEKRAYYMAEYSVEKVLKSPKTADFLGYSQSIVTKISDDGDYLVKLQVDSENSFGAMIRSTFTVKVKNVGDQWILIDIKEKQ